MPFIVTETHKNKISRLQQGTSDYFLLLLWQLVELLFSLFTTCLESLTCYWLQLPLLRNYSHEQDGLSEADYSTQFEKVSLQKIIIIQISSFAEVSNDTMYVLSHPDIPKIASF